MSFPLNYKKTRLEELQNVENTIEEQRQLAKYLKNAHNQLGLFANPTKKPKKKAIYTGFIQFTRVGRKKCCDDINS